MSEVISDVIGKIVADIEKKKERLLHEELVSKGYGHLISDIEKRIFPRVASVVLNGWTLYFADNGQHVPEFIIAFSSEPTTIQDEQSIGVKLHHRNGYLPGEKEALFGTTS